MCSLRGTQDWKPTHILLAHSPENELHTRPPLGVAPCPLNEALRISTNSCNSRGMFSRTSRHGALGIEEEPPTLRLCCSVVTSSYPSTRSSVHARCCFFWICEHAATYSSRFSIPAGFTGANQNLSEKTMVHGLQLAVILSFPRMEYAFPRHAH